MYHKSVIGQDYFDKKHENAIVYSGNLGDQREESSVYRMTDDQVL